MQVDDAETVCSLIESVVENCTVMGMTGSPRGPRVTRGDGGKLHGLAAGMGAKNTGSPRGWAQ